MSVGVVAKLPAMVPDVRAVAPMTGEQLVKMASGNLERVKPKTCPAHTALHTS